jgi:hypothetical protein
MRYHTFPIPIANHFASRTSENTSEEAAVLARRCSEPCPAGDYVKAAVGRAAERAGINYRRMRDIWYGDARRIDSWEMDALRRGAVEAEMDMAVAGISLARQRIAGHRDPLARKVIASFDDALRILGRAPDAAPVKQRQ